jgi:hypothetical protein
MRSVRTARPHVSQLTSRPGSLPIFVSAVMFPRSLSAMPSPGDSAAGVMSRSAEAASSIPSQGRTRIDFLAREKHHTVHAQAVWAALPEEYRGIITNFPEFLQNDVVAVFAYGDLKKTAELGKKAVFADHGIGMFYNNTHPSYAGSTEGRENVILRLSPNEIHAKKERETLDCPVAVVGVPIMDRWHGWKPAQKRRPKKTIVFSFHWDCLVCPETRSSWKYYMRLLPSLKEKYNVIGHAHPKLYKKIEPIYLRHGIRPIEDFEEVMKKADVYVCDNSSTIYQFAYLGKPVVLLNGPTYRRDVVHEGNPRFWRHEKIWPSVNKASELTSALDEAIRNWSEIYKEPTQEILKEMFSFLDGQCAKRAARAIISVLEGRCPECQFEVKQNHSFECPNYKESEYKNLANYLK